MKIAQQPRETVDAISTIADALGNLLYLIRTEVNNPTAVLDYLDYADGRVNALNQLISSAEIASGQRRYPVA
ncbi:MAG TPA: hypothetical protein VG714_09170 [Acidobacteriaceae bacterium]|nr:hypothetical protein [Acidobacteriaceae bacterium]